MARGSRHRFAWSRSCAVVVLLLGGEAAAQELDDGAPGFGPELADLVSQRCAPCHSPGGSGPFPLLSYEDVAARARTLRAVIESRFMPPWKPEPGWGDFLGERRLSDEERSRFLAWLDAGAPRGAGSPVPPPPHAADVWRLGTPDRVYAMQQPFLVPAEGTDLFRTFVVPTEEARERYVTAVEFRVDNSRVTHHAGLFVNRDGRARTADATDPEPGFGGMDLPLFPDHGGLDGWIPGMTPFALPEGIAWRLPPGADLVFEGHFRPSGRAEPARLEVGLHFTADPPRGELVLLRMAVGGLNLPAGAADVRVDDTFELPVDARLLSILPHAHRVCREIRADATPPAGDVVPLLWIRDWDFDWQDVYRYADPVALARGTRLGAHFRYDNSAANPRNPHAPPRRVLGGTQTEDEMAFVWLQLLVAGPEDARLLREAAERTTRAKDADYRLEVLWRELVARVDGDGDGSLDAAEERAAEKFLAELPDRPELLRTCFDLDASGELEPAERSELERFLAPWEGAR